MSKRIRELIKRIEQFLPRCAGTTSTEFVRFLYDVEELIAYAKRRKRV